MTKPPTTPLLLLALAVAGAAAPAWAQNRIYRCGNEYTNDATRAKERGCKLVEGGNVTVVPGMRPAPASGAAPSAAPAAAPRVNDSEQRARDSDARAILEAELRKAEARRAELLKEYNDGFPQRSALEMRNVQAYQERTAALKAEIDRVESDIASLRRELGRLPASSGGSK
ncbi:hypothetical protein [Extensimonas vulgaris]|uniref:Uncharacterized protein n=1 Tax=Extensimonas vulgaris TaxID=1031594 RepID=A0A369ATT9_9BURK|nr:hypothetical protein [Extensimonas vulgaris]RCX11758.1 hypothetical protein DFR45_101287 [Extensimonas vulgaris]TWI40652.1 hypothetical protein IP95_00841 [Extensimonas vulgaris]